MRIIFRADASVDLGIGHVMRCLTLASELAERGATISFICQDLPGNLCSHIDAQGYVAHCFSAGEKDRYPLDKAWQSQSNDQELLDAKESLKILQAVVQPVDWLIVDHYHLSATWETQLRPFVKKLMVIDDLANRKHDCDILLDQNVYNNFETRYENLIPESCIKLLGPSFLLIGLQFNKRAHAEREHNKNIKNVLITMGGSDVLNVTLWTLTCVLEAKIPRQIDITIVTGSAYKHSSQLKEIIQSSHLNKITYFHDINTMADLMRETDLAITAGGFTVYELLASEVSSLVIAANDSQVPAMAELNNLGAIEFIGKFHEHLSERFKEKVLTLINDFEKRKSIARVGRELIDNRGLERVANVLLN